MQRKQVHLTTALTTGLLALTLTSGLQAKNHKDDNEKKSQKGGLPALEQRVAALESLVTDLQGAGGFSGEYHTTLFETGSFGCGMTNDPAALLGTPAFIEYLGKQAISSATTRTANFVAEADGDSLYFPEYVTNIQEIRLSGTPEQDTRLEGNISIDISDSGELSVDAGPDVTTSGYMSANGDNFTFMATGLFDEAGCDDAFSVIAIGNRIRTSQ